LYYDRRTFKKGKSFFPKVRDWVIEENEPVE